MHRVEPGPWEYGRPREDADIRAYAKAMAEAFAINRAETEQWLETSGHDHLRVITRDGTVVGGLIEVPMGQFLGGRRVKVAGVAGVALATEHRGSGGAQALMRGALAEFRERGFAVSTLYASTTRFYRRLGYERAGGLYEVEAAMHILPRGRSDLAMRAATQADHPVIEAIYRERAQTQHGFADRGPYLWHRIRRPWRGKTSYGFVVEDEGRVEGYLYLGRTARPGAIDVAILDWGARTPAAFQRLLHATAGEFALAEKLTLKTGAATDPWVLGLSERQYQVRLVEPWMVRILDVPAAFEGRGYPTSVTATVELAVDDSEISANEDRWILEFDDGQCRARRGGHGTLRCGARALAPLLTGGSSPRELYLAGALEGPMPAIDQLERLLAGPTPAMLDYF